MISALQPTTNCSIKLLQTLITFYTRFCRRHPMHPNTTVSDNAHIHCRSLHIPLTSLTVILLHAWCTKTVISTSHFISSVLFIYLTVLACVLSCHLINENDDDDDDDDDDDVSVLFNLAL